MKEVILFDSSFNNYLDENGEFDEFYYDECFNDVASNIDNAIKDNFVLVVGRDIDYARDKNGDTIVKDWSSPSAYGGPSLVREDRGYVFGCGFKEILNELPAEFDNSQIFINENGNLTIIESGKVYFELKKLTEDGYTQAQAFLFDVSFDEMEADKEIDYFSPDRKYPDCGICYEKTGYELNHEESRYLFDNPNQKFSTKIRIKGVDYDDERKTKIYKR